MTESVKEYCEYNTMKFFHITGTWRLNSTLNENWLAYWGFGNTPAAPAIIIKIYAL